MTASACTVVVGAAGARERRLGARAADRGRITGTSVEAVELPAGEASAPLAMTAGRGLEVQAASGCQHVVGMVMTTGDAVATIAPDATIGDAIAALAATQVGAGRYGDIAP